MVKKYSFCMILFLLTNFSLAQYTEIGCYSLRMKYKKLAQSYSLTVEFCARICAVGFDGFGLIKINCICRNISDLIGRQKNDSSCDFTCAGNNTQKCGSAFGANTGQGAISTYLYDKVKQDTIESVKHQDTIANSYSTASSVTIIKLSSVSQINETNANDKITEQIVARVMQKLGSGWVIGTTTTSITIFAILKPRGYERFLQSSEEVTLLFAHLVLAFYSYIASYSVITCKIVSMLLEFIFVSNFCFLLLEAIQAYCILTTVIYNGRLFSYKASLTFALGLSFFATIMSISLKWENLTNNFSCWVNFGNDFWYTSVAHILMITVICIITWEATGMQLGRRFVGTDKQQLFTAKVNYFSAIIKIPLNFFAWFFGVTALFYKNIGLYAFAFAFNISIGFAILFFHLFSEPKVKQWANLLRLKINKATKPVNHIQQ